MSMTYHPTSYTLFSFFANDIFVIGKIGQIIMKTRTEHFRQKRSNRRQNSLDKIQHNL